MSIPASDFHYLQSLIRQRSGNVLDDRKEYLVEARLAPLVREHDYEDVAALVKDLRSAPFNGLHRHVVEAMTTNETSFFRDVLPFEVLRDPVLPELIARRRVERSLSIWCAASSTGQEAYSIAMTLREHFPQLASWRVTMVASDISSKVLERARRGAFSQIEVSRGLPARFLSRYFQRQQTEWVIRGDLRQMVDFREINIVEPWPPLPPFDIVFLRNLLIYFDLETKRTVFSRLRRVLRPDGYLFLGAAETTMNIDDAFERVQVSGSGYYRLRS